jgi:hypothetical protein
MEHMNEEMTVLTATYRTLPGMSVMRLLSVCEEKELDDMTIETASFPKLNGHGVKLRIPHSKG